MSTRSAAIEVRFSRDEPYLVQEVIRLAVAHARRRYKAVDASRVVPGPGFLTACRLYAAAVAHQKASPELRQALYEQAVACVRISSREKATA